MAKTKVAFIGGGSYQWGIKLTRDMLVTKGLDGAHLMLMDIDPVAANTVRRATLATQKRAKTHWKVEATTSRRKALEGADFVVISISTGAFDSMEYDLSVPWKYDVHQTVGDTVGPGGLNRALRNIPVFEDFARDILRYCPDAWVLNVTNPMTTLTRTLFARGLTKVVGLCHEVYGGRDAAAGLLAIDPNDPKFDIQIAGVNHCIWLTGCTHDGIDQLGKLRRTCRDKKYAMSLGHRDKSAKAMEQFEGLWKSHQVKRYLCEATGYMPMVGDRHIVEFFGHFTRDTEALPAKWGVHVTTIEDRRTKWLPPMRKYTRGVAAGKEKIELECSAEPLAPIMDAIANNNVYHLLAGNLPNVGQTPNLQAGAVVETPCVVTAGGVQPVTVGPLPDAVAAVVAPHAHRQEMIVRAGMTADRQLALAALISDPMVQDAGTAPKMLKGMMDATRQWLPQFYPKRKKARR